MELDDLFVLCTVPLLCVLIRPAHDHNLPFSNVPDGLVPVFPIQMRGQIPSMPGLFFYRHQVPLTLGFAFTDYKSQGSTFTSLILGLLFGKQRGVDQYVSGPRSMSSWAGSSQYSPTARSNVS